MAISTVGTFPILNFKKSQTDEYGFDYVSYQFTIETEPLFFTYSIPKKDDVFLGYLQKTYIGTVGYVVDTVETNNIDGGLTELTINTIGCKNSIESNPPRVCLLSGCPIIFGLLGTPPLIVGAGTSICGYGIAGAGQSVEVKFLAAGGTLGQVEVFSNNFASLMPAKFRGVSLPVSARLPHTFSNIILSNGFMLGISGFYYGFVCKTITTEKRGGLLLATLIFSEAGVAVDYGIIGGKQAEIVRYNFPIVG